MNPRASTLTCDRKTRRFWTLLDEDGTLLANNTSSEVDRGTESHLEVTLFTSASVAQRAEDLARADGEKVCAVEVTVTLTERSASRKQRRSKR